LELAKFENPFPLAILGYHGRHKRFFIKPAMGGGSRKIHPYVRP